MGEGNGPVGAGPQYSGDRAKLLMEQYKLYVEGSSKVSDRRGAANSFLLSTNTALVAVYALAAGRETALASADLLWRWLIPLAGILLALAWFALIRGYRAVNAAKFAVIQKLERELPAAPFGDEWAHLGEGKTYTPLSHVEQIVPAVFGAIYLGLILDIALR